MKQYISYIKYLLRHKYQVIKVGLTIGGIPFFQLLMHDMSRFFPREFSAYANTYYDKDGKSKPYESNDKMDAAWSIHQKRNKHHYQYWVIIDEQHGHYCLEIPTRYIKEMAADMIAMGQIVDGSLSAWEYYMKNRDRFYINNASRLLFEELLMKYSKENKS